MGQGLCPSTYKRLSSSSRENTDVFQFKPKLSEVYQQKYSIFKLYFH